MKFEEALVLLRQGRKIRRACWDGSYYRYAFLGEGRIQIAVQASDFDCINGVFWCVDILAEDWMVVDDID